MLLFGIMLFVILLFKLKGKKSWNN